MKNTRFNSTKAYLKSKNLFTESQIDIIAEELQFIPEQQLNEWSLKELKAKASEILSKAKEKTTDLIDKAKNGELTRATAKKVQAVNNAVAKKIDDLKKKTEDSGLGDKAKNIFKNVKDKVSDIIDDAGETCQKISGKVHSVGQKTKDIISGTTGIKPETLDKIVDKSGNIVFSALYKSINTASAGNITDQIIEHYMNEVGNKLSEDELRSVINQLVKDFPKLKKQNDKDNSAEDKEEADKQTDKNESTEIDEKSCTFYAMFQDELGKNLRHAIIDMDKQQAQTIDSIAEFEKDIPDIINKNGGESLPEDDKKKYGMIIISLMAKGFKGEKLKQALETIKKGKTSSDNKTDDHITAESALNIYVKKQFNEEIEYTSDLACAKDLNLTWLNEKFLRWLYDHAKGSNLKWGRLFLSAEDTLNTKMLNDKASTEFVSKVKDQTENAALGFNFDIVGPVAVMAIGAILYKYRKPIINGVGTFVQKLKNKKGVIAAMKFKPMGSENEYKLQFSVTDFVWRVINIKNPKKLVKEELVKGALDSSIGQKFRKKCAEIWIPIFGISNNKVPAFYKLIEGGGEMIGLSKNDIKSIKDFGDNFKKIKDTCLSDNYKYDIRNK